MMCRLVVGERAHQRPKQKAEHPNDPKLYVKIERQAQTEIEGNGSDQESDEYANQEPHLSLATTLQKRANTCPLAYTVPLFMFR